MRSRRIPLRIFAALLFAQGILSHASAVSPCRQEPGNPSPALRLPDEDTPRELVYPYYSLKEGYDSNLGMMDRAPRPIEFTVAVHSLSGKTVVSKPMTIQPSEELVINVKKLLTGMDVDYRGDFLEGSLTIHFKGRGNPLGGRMLVEGPHETLNLGPVWSMGESGLNMLPDRLNTLWYDLGGARDVEATVTNITNQPVSADLYLDFAGERHAAPLLRFAPHETKHVSVTEVLAAMKLTAYHAPTGGLSIVPRTPKLSLVAQGKITDPESGRITALKFPLPQLEVVSSLHASGVPISIPSEDSPFAGVKGADFLPHLYVRNLLPSEQTLNITVEYSREGRPDFTPLPPITVRGYTMQDIRLDSYFSLLPLPLPFCSLQIRYNGPPGSVMAEVVSVNETSGKANEILVVNEGNGYAGSLASYWGFDDDTDFIVFLTNMGDRPCRVGFRIETSGVVYYLTKLELLPRETQVISLRELRDKQQPDFRGTVIPANAVEGRLFYNRVDNVPMMGRVTVVPRKR